MAIKVGDLVELFKCQSFGGVDLYDVGVVIEVMQHKVSGRRARPSPHNTYMVQWATANRAMAVSGWILRPMTERPVFLK